MYNQQTTKLLGNTVKSFATFTDFSGKPVVPLTVTFSYKPPSGEIITVNVIPVSGQYSFTRILDQVGSWYFRWESSGDYAAADEFTVQVNDTLVK